MRYFLVVIVLTVFCAAQMASAQSTPVVTIDTNKNFCINGVPTFILGTIGGNDYAWQNYLAPAGFNIRFLGNPSVPGANSVGLWEAPDVLSDPSSVSGLKDNPSVLTWTLGYQIDTSLRELNNWPGCTPIDVVDKRQQCISLDNKPSRPVGVIWGNDHMLYGYEFTARDGYWYSTRQFEQLTDYFVSGDWNNVEDNTITNSVRLSLNPVIAKYYCMAGSVGVAQYCSKAEQLGMELWTSVIAGAKGIIVDRYESQNGYTWTHDLDPVYWETIKKCTSDIKQLSPALLAPGPVVYYKTKPNEVDGFFLLYTHRMVGRDLYFIAVNRWELSSVTKTFTVPVIESGVKGEVLYDPLAKGVMSFVPTSTTITDTTKSWTTNQLAGHRLWIRHGSPSHEHRYTILSNTNNTITIAGGDLLVDGGQKWDYYWVNELVDKTFACRLPACGRKVIKFENVTNYVNIPKTPEAVGKPSNRRWVELMDWSGCYPDQRWPADGYGLAYDTTRHRLVCFGGVEYQWPNGKPALTEPDVWVTPCVYEWDIDGSFFSGRLYTDNSVVGDGWPGGILNSDLVYDSSRRCCAAYLGDGMLWEWYGPNLGWRKVQPGPGEPNPGAMSHYPACYDPASQRFLMYGGKNNNHIAMQYRGAQFKYEWCNQLFGHTNAGWYDHNNTDVNLPYAPLEEPQMVWDTNRQAAVLFGTSHDGRRTKDTDPLKHYQDVPQQTYEIGTSSVICNYRSTSHVPYVFANYRMVFDPRTASTLLFGGLPSKNGRITDLYEYNGTDWSRLDYDSSSLPAQDVRRTPSLVWDPDHQMVIFLDTRTKKIWGLTSGTETTVTNIDAARALSPNSSLVLEGMYVSRVFDGCFYIQDAARTTGIKVVSSTVPEIGKKVNVIGTLMQNASGEKYLQAKVVGQTGSGTVEPLAMANSALAGKAAGSRPGADGALGVNNTGILVRVWGSVSYIGSGYIYIDDGTGLLDGSGHTGVKVQLNGVSSPASGATIAVTGISATERVGTTNARVVLLSRAEDLSCY